MANRVSWSYGCLSALVGRGKGVLDGKGMAGGEGDGRWVGEGRGEGEVGIWVRSSNGKGHAFCWSWHTFRNEIIHLKGMLCWNPVTIALKLIYMYCFLSNKHTVFILVPVTNRVPVQISCKR